MVWLFRDPSPWHWCQHAAGGSNMQSALTATRCLLPLPICASSPHCRPSHFSLSAWWVEHTVSSGSIAKALFHVLPLTEGWINDTPTNAFLLIKHYIPIFHRGIVLLMCHDSLSSPECFWKSGKSDTFLQNPTLYVLPHNHPADDVQKFYCAPLKLLQVNKCAHLTSSLIDLYAQSPQLHLPSVHLTA